MAKSYTAGPDLQTRLSAWAWERCAEAAETGCITLENGEVIDLLSPDKDMQARARNVLGQVRWLASLTAKKKPRVSMPPIKDEFLGQTK